jgi:DNA mismatch repair ATPase MutL
MLKWHVVEPAEELRLTLHEYEHFERYAAELRTWQFCFASATAAATWAPVTGLANTSGVSGNRIVHVTRLPIFCGVKLTVNDMRMFLAELHAHQASRKHVRPPAVSRILNNKACRGAIMFGDELSEVQCTEIVRRLAQCRFPFQCAHGRPSVTPLVDLRQ